VKDWFWGFIVVLSFSKKTQYAIIIGMVGYIVISLVGDHMLNDFQLSGILAPMSDSVKEKLLGKYGKAALGCLVSFWLLAMKLYRKDKKRFFSY